MAEIKLKGNLVNTFGDIPKVGDIIPNFKLVKNNLTDVTLDAYKGIKKILNIFPSLDTPTCALSVKRFNKEVSNLANTVILNISQDLPFAQHRFCTTEGIDKIETLSSFRSNFGEDYGVLIIDSPLKSLNARALIVTDENNRVIFSQLVPEISDEPDYEKALKALRQ